MRLKITTLLLLFLQFSAYAQGTLDDYKRAKEVYHTFGKVYNIPQQIVWSEDGESFAYRVKQKDNESALYLVDAKSKNKKRIDLEEVSKQMSTQLSETVRVNTNFIIGLKPVNSDEIEFTEKKKVWRWNIATAKLSVQRELGDSNREGGYWGGKWDDSKGEPVASPDKVYLAYIKNNNIYVRKKNDLKSEKQLTFDGSPGFYYSARIDWAGDSQKLSTSKVRKAEVRQLTLLESSPTDQLQPKLQYRDYVKPGDALSQYYPVIVHVETGKVVEVDPTQVDNQFSLSYSTWRPDNNAITFEYNQRGHQQYELIELNANTGVTRSVISETSKTFIDYSGKKYRKDIPKTNEVIWTSERDGWNHLYLFDYNTGKVKNQITKGEWVVRKVIHVDESNRKIIFEGSGKNKNEDPYLVRYYSVGLDGSNLRELTSESANHQGYFNKNFTQFIDVYSLIDQAPKAVLREAKTGKVLMDLENGDLSDLSASGWKAPEVFSSKGRDGTTDIWGIIIRPNNFDPNRKYPVIEYIYAGPHSSFVPKSFSTSLSGMYELAELGFIVVQIDGMGTSNRSKAFHDVAWKNLKDAGFPDRIAWMKTAAQKYPYMNLDKVGIYGTSAGGQSSTGAVLFHPEFYKVAVSSCGCHDNRMDKIWWNEQWMGWPIGPQYAESSNIENANRLEGKLMLIVGELDDNVDPASTYQLVNQLIKNGKEHELILVPGMGHSSGGDYGEKKRRDFFVKHLLGVDPPKWIY